MATTDRQRPEASAGLSDSEIPPEPLAALMQRAAPALAAAPQSSFFHVVSLLERLTLDAVRVGGDGPVEGERIRFRHDGDLGFSSGDISRAKVERMPRGSDAYLEAPIPVFRVETTFLGLTGITSPLPLYIAEEILHEDDTNPVRRDFLDVFHHRLISLFYRAVIKFMPPREHLAGQRDPWMERALCLTNLDPRIQTRTLRVQHPSVLVRLAPLLAGRGRGPRVLALALREVLREGLLPDGTVNIEEFAGGWIEVDEDQRMALGERNCELGVEAILGKRAYDQSGRFSVRIGPLHAHNYRRFLRDGDLLPIVKDVVELCSKESLDFDVKLELASDAVPSFQLSSRGGDGSAELGRDTRLRGAMRVAETMTIPDVGNMRFAPRA
ncbi:MAG: type VI secretion system baseplate subunit TssG [Sandaracinaceae bacterium]|nr:type VI secretion system baseplate subunit TssG [Sandaracinaceae bacterium]